MSPQATLARFNEKDEADLSTNAEERQVVVKLKNISKTFDSFTAVDDLSLDVYRGELLCLLGPSGCGKTTTLRMVAGFVEPTAGSVLISGTDVTGTPAYKRDTGMVFQSYALFPHMTVAENVAFGLTNLGVARPERESRVREILKLVELEHLMARYPRELSGGQQQRVALARALVLRPAVLLLDEPFSNLDAQLRVRLREELQGLISRVEITTLFVTHDQEEALMLSDRIAVMNAGRLEQLGAPEAIYERPETRFVAEFIGRCSIVDGNVRGGSFISKGGLELPVDAADGAVAVVIRPEAVRLATPSGDGMKLSGTVDAVHYFGSVTSLRVRVGGEELTMEGNFGPGSAKPRPGDEIVLEIDPRHLRTIPA